MKTFDNSTYLLSNNNNNNNKDNCLALQSNFLLIQGKISILWLIFGTIGNTLSFFVLSRAKMRIHSTFTYLMLLSICDTLAIYFGLLRDYLVYLYDININNDFLCKIHVFSFYFILHMASWLLVAVNIDRFIATSFLHFSKSWCTPRKAYIFSSFIALILLGINGHFLFYTQSMPKSANITIGVEPINPFVYKECIINKQAYKSYNYFIQNIFTWIDTSTQVILPFIIMIFCNFNIIYKVILTNKKTNGKNLKRLRRIKSMCIMILTVSALFIVLELPVLIVICLFQGGWITTDSSCNEFLFIITSLMMYTNHIINFVSYAMTGTQFRRELIYMLCLDKFKSFWNFKKPLNIDELATINGENNAIDFKKHYKQGSNLNGLIDYNRRNTSILQPNLVNKDAKRFLIQRSSTEQNLLRKSTSSTLPASATFKGMPISDLLKNQAKNNLNNNMNFHWPSKLTNLFKKHTLNKSFDSTLSFEFKINSLKNDLKEFNSKMQKFESSGQI